MVTCPLCNGAIDVEELDLDEGDTLACEECGAGLRVVGVNPLELESAEENADDEEDEDEENEEEEKWR